MMLFAGFRKLTFASILLALGNIAIIFSLYYRYNSRYYSFIFIHNVANSKNLGER